MKIIGLLTAWACEDWIEYSIKQALEIVDELIISIGPYNKFFKKIADKTLNIALKYKDNNKIKFVPTVYITKELRRTYSRNRCATLNQMLKKSDNNKEGNVIWLLDADEFFSQKAIKIIENFLTYQDFDSISLKTRFFCIDLNHYIELYHKRIFKIKDSKMYFTPTQKINPKSQIKIRLLDNEPMFHYSLLTGEQIRCIFWFGEDAYDRLIWYYKIYKKYDISDEIYWFKKNEVITRNFGFWFHTHVKEKDGRGLFEYNGKHPIIIENSHLKNISDFRIYYKEKPNFKDYLKVMKDILRKKRKIKYQELLKQHLYKKISDIISKLNYPKVLIQFLNKMFKKFTYIF